MIRITYPNIGVYEGGKGCFERLDKNGNVVEARLATEEEELTFQHIQAIHNLSADINQLTVIMHDLKNK